ncbi:restriction endonuclease-like protein [Halobacillus sp. Marseille-Q1614]|uniref:restriction endonuclease-like protein n=1 Tax=Halobacillus sp. Marseille-Q1614 TaxID=2709134 RepID=UPI00156D9605|nr:restriction endonuclease-like protein [Halobacillus sp. Marseille-Q1614]
MSNANDIKLLVMEHEEFSLHIKGKPFNRRFESLKQYKEKTKLDQQSMLLKVDGLDKANIQVFHPIKERLVNLPADDLPPIFFENEIYQIVVISKTDKELFFYHEHPLIRKSVSKETVGNLSFLMGQLQFMNEVGLTEFEIHDKNHTLAHITIELFPTKLDYKEDYQSLLDEISEEIYNLVFHFMKKTFLGASKISSKEPSIVEFYRLLTHYYHRFIQAVQQIERQPHHNLVTEYRSVRGDQLKRMDNVSRRYLRKRPHLFKETAQGIEIGNSTKMPEKGLNAKKSLSYDTLENRFVKFMVYRLQEKVQDLILKLEKYSRNNPDADTKVLEQSIKMDLELKAIVQRSFWRQISKLDRSVLSLVIQMKQGYRDAYMIYLILSQGLTLQGEIFKMSVKDVATLYEYWTYLKMGQILHKKYIAIDQDIIKIKQKGLFVDLDQSKTAKRTFKHSSTDELITLSFQERHQDPPTVRQKSDIMLTIQKKGHSYDYQYIFDAKYRIDFGPPRTQQLTPGPMEADINTMHRYRDAWVYKNDGPYERHAFGAYVLFPWMDEDNYDNHHFYKSINEVNIGGFPFLPNTTRLVEQFVERLVESSPEDLQHQGILPKGAIEHWESSLEEKVLVGVVKDARRLAIHKQECFYHIPVKQLSQGWQEAKYIALYIKQTEAKESNEPNGITYYGEISNAEIVKRSSITEVPSQSNQWYVKFHVDYWRNLEETIRPVGYGIRVYAITTMNILKNAKDLPELFMKSKDELKLWRFLRRYTKRVRTELDSTYLDTSTGITSFIVGDCKIKIDKPYDRLIISNKEGYEVSDSLTEFTHNPVMVFKKLQKLLI